METVDNSLLGKEPILPIKQRWMLLAIFVTGALLSQVFSIMQFARINDLIERIKGGDVGAAHEMAALMRGGDPLTLLAGVVGIAAIVFVCMWFYRAGQNVHLAGMKYLNYTPGWYVGWFFIPIVQVVMPYITTQELWRSSMSINNPAEYDSWKENKVSPLVHLWYFSFLLMLGVTMYFMFNNFENMRRAAFDPDAAVEYFSGMNKAIYFQIPLQTISGICLILFSKKITDKHNEYING